MSLSRRERPALDRVGCKFMQGEADVLCRGGAEHKARALTFHARGFFADERLELVGPLSRQVSPFPVLVRN
jgi:hypothetical protein